MSRYSALPENTPLLVGAGAVMQKTGEQDDLLQTADALELMLRALQNAEQDAGVSGLLRQADSIQTPQGFWGYVDPAGQIAKKIGAENACCVLADIGILQQTLLTRACRAIACGEEQVTLIVGGEARHRARRAERAGVELSDATGKDEMPDVWLQPDDDISAALENKRGLMMPVAAYAVIESALRRSRGLGVREHREELAALTASMSRVAAANEDAWERKECTAEQALDEGEKNAMLAFPYAKVHVSQWNVDQAAGLILCSAGAARRCGVSEDRWIFPLAAAETNYKIYLSGREHLHRSLGAELAARAVLELAEISAPELDFLELYSCFPAAVQMHAQALGVPVSPEKPPTVTGGMHFAGGPLNNYVLQSTVRMARCLRQKPGAAGLVSCVSGILNKHGFAVWASRAPARLFRSQELGNKMRRSCTKYALEAGYRGPAEVTGYTVLHQKSQPSCAVAVCTLPGSGKRRTVAQCEEPAVMEQIMREEFCGRQLLISSPGKFILP